MKVGDLVRWLDPRSNWRHGLIVSILSGPGYYDVLIDGKIEFCHERNMEFVSESR